MCEDFKNDELMQRDHCCHILWYEYCIVFEKEKLTFLIDWFKKAKVEILEKSKKKGSQQKITIFLQTDQHFVYKVMFITVKTCFSIKHLAYLRMAYS